MPPAEPEERRGAEQVVVGGEPIRDQLATLSRLSASTPLLVLAGEPDLDQVREGRIAQGPPPLELLGEEAGRVVPRGVADARRAGRQRLNQDPPARLTPAAPAGELGDQREGALLGAEVGQAQARRRRRGSTLRVTSGKSWPLATIWVPTSTPDSARLEAPENLGVATPGGAVGVEPEDLEGRQQLGELGLHPLGPGSHPRDRHR